jgi:glycerophosphoryl diester phosphodiesterase
VRDVKPAIKIATMPEIIAHRGASADAHENTLAAFMRAIDQGADGIELDVHATQDDVVVVHHDPVLRLPGGVPPRPIAGMSSTEIAAVRLASGDPIPTLDDTLTLVGARAVVYVEVKAVGIEAALVACLRRHPGCRAAVHAFDHRIPVAVREAMPGVPIGFLSASYPLDVGGSLAHGTPEALWQHASIIDAALVHAAHARGARVIAWTENDPARARALFAMGVDAVCTDTPGLLRARLAG